MTRVVFVYSKEPYDVYIGRGRDPKTGAFHNTILTGKAGDWGNPWTHKNSAIAEFHVESREEAIEAFQAYLEEHPELKARIRRELKDKTLGCWCKTAKHPTAACHGDVYAAIADSEE